MNVAADHRVTCVYCLLIVVEAERTNCPGCSAPHHQNCWDELGGCSFYGCPQMVETKKADDQIVTYWGAVDKKCPVCAEVIPVAALECKFCRSTFEDIRPMTLADLLEPEEEAWVKSYRRSAIWLIVFSAIGCTSLPSFVIGLIWYFTRKERLKLVPATRGLVLIALGINVVYAVVLPLGWLAFSLKEFK